MTAKHRIKLDGYAPRRLGVINHYLCFHAEAQRHKDLAEPDVSWRDE